MKIFGINIKNRRKNSVRDAVFKDTYQESLNKLGGEQFRRLIDKGLRLPVGNF